MATRTGPTYAITFALVLWVAGCRCPGDTTRLSLGEIAFEFEDADGNTLTQEDGVCDFGQVYMGQAKPLKLRIRNTGSGVLGLVGFSKASGDAVDLQPLVVEANAVFKVVYANVDIGSGASQEYDISFWPPTDPDPNVRTRQHEVLLTLALSNAQKPTALVTLKGTGVSGVCELPEELDFGAVARGDSFNREVLFSNPGPLNSVATIGAITSNTGDDKAFAFTADTPLGDVTVVPGAPKKATIVFSPTETRDYLALVNMRASDQCPDVTVKLIGTGVDSVLTWTPSPLDFGYVMPGISVPKELTFQNLSMAPVTLSNLRTLSSDFKIEQTATTLVVPAATRNDTRVLVPGEVKLPMSFKPTLLGPRSSQLAFATTLTKQPTGAAQLKGYGGGPDIDVKPSPIMNVGRVAYFAGATTPTFVNRKITVQNVGTRPTPPDPKANLHLGVGGTGALWKVTAKNANTTTDEICLGVWDATAGCTNTLSATAYNPTLGLEAQGARALVDIPVRITPASVGAKEWEVELYSDDPDEATFILTVKADAVVLPPCNYRVTPTALNFGLVTPPDYKDLAFTIKNLAMNAGEVCLVSNLDIKVGSDPIFTLPAGAVTDKELQPGEAMTVVVRAWPQGVLPATVTSAQGFVNFNISSPATPERDVSLTAAIAQSCLTISPDDLDFGTVQKDCNSATRTFSIYNTCTGNVTVNSFGMAAAAGQPAGGPNCPGPSPCPEFIPVSTAGIAPGSVITPNSAPVTFSLKYRPIDFGADTGAFLLKVTQNGQVVDYIVTLRGTGDTVGLNTDTFRQDSKPKADILLIIDDSGSMSDKQQALATNFSSFIRYAVSAQIDWQIGVTTTDQVSTNRRGRIIGDVNNPKILTSGMANVESLFQAKVKVGTIGSPDEQSASIAVAALTAPLITSENAGLIRSDASLAVVTVTDAEDQSPLPAAQYLSQLHNIKGLQRASMFSYSGIVPTLPAAPAGCGYDSAAAASDPKHSQMIQGGGGIMEEICSADWAQALERVGVSAFGYRADFFLVATPDTSKPIVIKQDGVFLNSTDSRGALVWSYDLFGNLVHFEPLYVPEPGTTLTITYSVHCIP